MFVNDMLTLNLYSFWIIFHLFILLGCVVNNSTMLSQDVETYILQGKTERVVRFFDLGYVI